MTDVRDVARMYDARVGGYWCSVPAKQDAAFGVGVVSDARMMCMICKRAEWSGRASKQSIRVSKERECRRESRNEEDEKRAPSGN